MSLGATFLGGAQSRLLPPSLPFRFFIAGIVFHVLMWGALIFAARDVPAFAGGVGPALAALHLLTLGVFGSVAIGAALQMLPVATRRPMPTSWPVRLAFWLFVPGVVLLVHGMAVYSVGLMEAGATLAGAALLLLAILLADNLRRAKDLPLVAAYGWLAVISLILLVLFGVILVFDFDLGLLGDHAAFGLAHLVLAVFGFMGMLAIGFSHVLVPMFSLAPAPPGTAGRYGVAAWSAALLAAFIGALVASRLLFALGILLALAGAGVYLWTMAWLWRRRLRKRLGLSFLLARVAWVLLPVSLLAGLAATFGLAGPRGFALAGFLALWGWLLTFLMAILQRIMPFLASMHAAKVKGKPPLLSELTAETPLRIHAAGHFTALALVAAGIAADLPLLIRIGAAAGLVGAVAFAVFAVPILRRLFFVAREAEAAA